MCFHWFFNSGKKIRRPITVNADAVFTIAGTRIFRRILQRVFHVFCTEIKKNPTRSENVFPDFLVFFPTMLVLISAEFLKLS